MLSTSTMTNKVFTNGEIVKFVNSGVSAVALEYPRREVENIIEDFYIHLMDKNDTFYDISRLRREDQMQQFLAEN